MLTRCRTYFLLIAVALLSATACERTALSPGGDNPDNAISLALSLKHIGDSPAAQTKMSTDITQDNAPFRGIEQVCVIPFQTEVDEETEEASPATATSARLGSSNVVIQNSAISRNGLVANNYSHLYNIVQVPVLTNRVLAYGKAYDTGSVSTKEGKHKNGVLTASGLDDPDTPGDISFSLESVLEAGELDEINQTAKELIDALNGVVAVFQASDLADAQTFLNTFTFKNQIIACSCPAIDQLEKSLLVALSEYRWDTPDAEAIAAVIAAAMTKLSELQDAYNRAGSDFPASYGIPEGAIGMWWNGYRYVKIIEGVNISLVPASLYCYPPSLWYYANSTIKTSDNDNVNQQYTPANTSWSLILSHYNGSSVMSSTRAVAIVDQMQYGVGLVEFRFLAPGVDAAAAYGCPLTGVIIGDQKDADYSFAPKSPSSSRFVYDNNISGITLGGSSQSFQTLVLPTTVGQSLHFALEFENNTGAEFRCQQGVVRPGCKFYLAGELTPDDEDPASVFEPDHKTIVKVQVVNLNNIYNTVPDLCDPQLELGVEAVMDWIQLEPGGVKLPF